MFIAIKMEKNYTWFKDRFVNKIMNLKNIIWNSKYMLTDQ